MNVHPGSQYNFTQPNSAVAKLPPEALEKLAALRESALRGTAMRDGLATAYNTARENFDEARNDLARFIRDNGEVFTAIEETDEVDERTGHKKTVRVQRDRPEVATLKERIARFRTEMTKISERQAALLSGFSIDTLLAEVAQIEGKLVPVAPPKMTERGSPKEMLAALREKQSDLEASIEEISTSPLTIAEAKAKLRAEIDVLAAQGAPDATTLLHHGGTIAWHEQQIIASGMGVHQYSTVSQQRDAFSLLVWLHKDKLLKELDAQIEAEGNSVTALSAEERAAKLVEMNKRLINLQRQEEALICRMEDEGAMVVTRRNSDPLILLEVELVPSK